MCTDASARNPDIYNRKITSDVRGKLEKPWQKYSVAVVIMTGI